MMYVKCRIFSFQAKHLCYLKGLGPKTPLRDKTVTGVLAKNQLNNPGENSGRPGHALAAARMRFLWLLVASAWATDTNGTRR